MKDRSSPPGKDRGAGGKSRPPRRPDQKGGAPAGKHSRGKPSGERSFGDKPARGKPYGDKPSGERSGSKSFDRPARSKPYGDKPSGERSGGGKSFDRPARSKPYGDKSSDDRPSRGKTYGDRPSGERSYGGKPRGDRPFDGERSGGKTFERKPRGERPDGRKGGDRDRNHDRPRPAGRNFDRPRNRPHERRDAAPQPDIRGLSANLWGVHAVQEAWLNPARRIHKLYVTETALESFEAVREKGASQGLKRPEPFLLDRKTLDRMLPDGAVHQGLAVDAAPLDELFAQDLVSRAMAKERSILLILDQLTDPHNVGAIMRSASAFGAVGIIMQTRHSPEITGVLAKAACGAVEHIPVAYETNLGRAMALLQENGFTAIGLDERGTITLAEVEKPARAVIVLGAEGKGLRQNLRESCDIVARLPTQGSIQSLNVSNAAAVALYALL